MESVNLTGVAWGMACLPHPTQSILGDGFVVKPIHNGLMLAVADGLGHGSEAAIASALCIDTLARNAELPIPELLRVCHETMRGTRGATMSVASFDYASDEMTWSGVGDVAAVLIRADAATPPSLESLVLRAGLLGNGSPAFTASRTRIGRGDLVVLATDGIGPGFERTVVRDETPQAVAERVLADHAKRTDDALVLVARYTGGRA
jgi:negative regulator of sigma-B (phosphoserine phosphatase)